MLLFSFADASGVYSETQERQTSFYFCEGIGVIYFILNREFSFLLWVGVKRTFFTGSELERSKHEAILSSKVPNMLYDKNKLLEGKFVCQFI